VAGVVGATITSSARQALAINFDDSVQVALWYDVAVFALSLLLLFFLPSPQHLGGPPAVVAE
jgi:hypothetical protein